jgi:hypothetical protein
MALPEIKESREEPVLATVGENAPNTGPLFPLQLGEATVRPKFLLKKE